MRTFVVLLIGCGTLLLCELAQQAGLITDLTESTSRTVVWMAITPLLIYFAYRSSADRFVMAALIAFAVCSTMGFVIGVTEDIRSLDGAPLVGRDGAMTHMVKKSLLAGWACSLGLVFYRLCRTVDMASETLELRVKERTEELLLSRRRLQQEVDAKVNVENELARSEERLRIALTNAKSTVWDINMKTGELVSPIALTWLGYETADRQFWKELIHPDDRDIPVEAYTACLEGKTTEYECEYRVRAGDGQWRWTLDRGQVIEHDEAGKPQRIVGSDTDITELKQSQSALNQSLSELDERVQKRTRELRGAVAKLEREIAERKRTSRILESIAATTAGDTGDDFFRSLVRNVATMLEVKYALITERLDQPPTQVRTLAFWMDDHFGDSFAYDLENTPCQVVMDGTPATFSCNVQDLFPHNRMLADLAVMSYCALPLTDSLGQVIGHLAVMDDDEIDGGVEEMPALMVFGARAAAEIERLRSERTTRESETRFRAMAEIAQEIICELNGDGDILYLNPASHSLLGWSTDELLGRSLLEKIHPEDLERVAVRFSQAIQTGQSAAAARVYHKSGGFLWIEANARTYKNAHGDLRVVIIARDVTERRRAEDELLESQQQYRNLLEGHVDAVGVTIDGAVVYANSELIQLSGYSPDEIIGLRPVDFIAPEDRERAARRVADIVAGAKEFPSEYEFLKSDGTRVPVEIRSRRTSYAGRPALLSVIRDISERRETQKLAQLHRDELARVNRLSTMGEMATGLAHEINQPLTAIANYADAAEQMAATGAPTTNLRPIMSQICEQSFRAGEIIRRLRSLVQRAEPNRSSIDVRELINEVLSLVENEFRLNSVLIQLNLPDGLPLLMADRIQLQQVVLNIVRNSLDAMADQGNEPHELTIEALVEEDGFVEVRVLDNGVGFPNGDLETIFEVFESSKPDGLGMGLAISRSIVEAHGGRIWATQQSSAGACFHIRLPIEHEFNP